MIESNAMQIRDRYKELLDDGVPHSRKELFAYAKENSEGNAYTDSMLAGALKTLVDSDNMFCCIERGIYQKIDPLKKTQVILFRIISPYLKEH